MPIATSLAILESQAKEFLPVGRLSIFAWVIYSAQRLEAFFGSRAQTLRCRGIWPATRPEGLGLDRRSTGRSSRPGAAKTQRHEVEKYPLGIQGERAGEKGFIIGLSTA